MAPRIPVVFSQGGTLSPQQREHEEMLIAELLLEDRVEVSLIGPLPHLSEDDTDCLCLLGFQGDFILMSSCESAKAFEELDRLAVEGRQGRTAFEPSGELRQTQTRRSIYHVPVTGRTRPEVRGEIERLRRDAEIATVPLLGLDGIAAASRRATATPQTPAVPPSPPPVAKQPFAKQPFAPPAEKTEEAQPAQKADVEAPIAPLADEFMAWDDDTLDAQLESLVDELDDMDI
jgi:hypothetical protein